MDKAGNKGTGNWATIASAQLGVPSTMIATALFARYTSFYKDDRIKLSAVYDNSSNEKPALTEADLFDAYQFCRIINHYQGLRLISEASKKYEWNLNLSEIARIWTNGCIIRSTLVKELVTILAESEELLHNKIIIAWIQKLRPAASKVVAQSILAGITVPCMSEAMNFFNGMTTARSTANLIQAQRDYFGAHTYQRIDDPTHKFHHTIWT